MALTFDDGPSPRWTPRVLHALSAAGAPATFFVLGECVAAHPAVVERILEAGHAVELHGHAHLRHPLAGRDAVAADTEAALAALEALGVTARLWRVPWGELAPWTPALAAGFGLSLAGWTADTHDWRGDDARAMLAGVAPRLSAGAVVLAHDGLGPGARRTGCEETVRLVAPLVAAVRERGLEPALLSPDWDVPIGNPDLVGTGTA
jgi:peptidoglycan/xylan/chitin deacetylase (PgdA/CDA1 family)